MKRIKFVRDEIMDFLLSLDDKMVAKVISSLELLDELGEQIRPPKSKKISKNIFELRILSSLSVRIFYTFKNEDIWILHAFIKKSQKIPPRELEVVINRLNCLQ